jgi:hypothetical protein
VGFEVPAGIVILKFEGLEMVRLVPVELKAYAKVGAGTFINSSKATGLPFQFLYSLSSPGVPENMTVLSTVATYF